jgi:transposase
MRFVPIQTDDQLYMQSLHRVRERWVIRRTAVGQPDPGLLLERGITLRQGRRHLEAALPEILEDTTAKLSGALRVLISQLKHELEELANFNRGDWKRGCLPERSRVLSLGGYGARESSTGGKQKLMGISKRGNPYLRKLLIQGVRAVMLRGTKQSEHGSRTSLCGSTIMSQRWLLRTKWPESPGSFWDRRNLSTLVCLPRQSPV